MRPPALSTSAPALVFLASSLFLCTPLALAAPTLDLSDMNALQKATEASIKNLVAMYDYADDGGFNQVDLPWWACTLLVAVTVDLP